MQTEYKKEHSVYRCMILLLLWFFNQFNVHGACWKFSIDFEIPDRDSYFSNLGIGMPPQTAKFMGPTWGPPGSCRPQVGPVLVPWTLLSGIVLEAALGDPCPDPQHPTSLHKRQDSTWWSHACSWLGCVYMILLHQRWILLRNNILRYANGMPS